MKTSSIFRRKSFPSIFVLESSTFTLFFSFYDIFPYIRDFWALVELSEIISRVEGKRMGWLRQQEPKKKNIWRKKRILFWDREKIGENVVGNLTSALHTFSETMI